MEIFKDKLRHQDITERLSIRRMREMAEAEIRFLEKREKQREAVMRENEARQALEEARRAAAARRK